MKKTFVIAVFALVCAAVLSLAGCSVGFVNTYRYDNADKYTAGDREFTEKIDALDIDWSSGGVTVTAADVSKVSVKDTTKAQLADELKVHTWAEGSVLHVRFCRSGEHYDGNEPKTVEVTVPKETLFENVYIDVSSADVSCSGLSAQNTEFDSSSGILSFDGNTDSFSADSSSGNINFKGEAGSIKTGSSSGNVSISQTGQTDSVTVDTSSGNLSLEADSVKNITADSSSGDKTLRLKEMPENVSLDSSSGCVYLYLPEKAGFDAVIDTSSGAVSCELPLTKTGENDYTCGSGGSKLTVDTSSGDVKIMKL